MSTLAFDTHKAVKALKEAGFGDAQAEAVVATVGDAIGGDVATKGDIVALQNDIAGFKSEVKADIAEFKAEIYRHFWLMAGGIVGLTVTLVKLIP